MFLGSFQVFRKSMHFYLVAITHLLLARGQATTQANTAAKDFCKTTSLENENGVVKQEER